jgi:hypothetical protein
MMTIFDDSINSNEINNIASGLKWDIIYKIRNQKHKNDDEIRNEDFIDGLILEIAKLKYKLEDK